MEKGSQSSKKLVKMETVLLVSFITLIVGFVGGIVFSAFKMGNSIPSSAGMVSPEAQETRQTLTPEQMEEISNLEDAARQSPENAKAWIALGNASYDYNLPEKAIEAYETALALQPANADVWTDTGIMYRRKGDPEKAVALFEKAQEVSPGHEMSLLNAGIVRLHDLDDPAGALIAWEKLLEINPAATTAGGMPIRDFVDALKTQQ
jgi:cytochrome c-type biogenesis protein CcmH/NrfG